MFFYKKVVILSFYTEIKLYLKVKDLKYITKIDEDKLNILVVITFNIFLVNYTTLW
jgi:hypothetical protein